MGTSRGTQPVRTTSLSSARATPTCALISQQDTEARGLPAEKGPEARCPVSVLEPSELWLTFHPSPSLPQDPKGLQPFGKIPCQR